MIRASWTCLHKAIINTVNHDGIEHAGYLAFLGLLAMFPFLVFVFAIIGFLGEGQAGASFIAHALQALPNHVADALKPRVLEIVSGPPQGLVTAAILGAVWTASSAVEGLRTVLNRAYHVATPPAYWFRRSLSVLQLLLFTFILVVGMTLVIFIPLALHHIEGWLGVAFISANEEYLGRVAFITTIALMFSAVAGIYYLIPNIRQHFVTVAPGALVVVALWLGAAHLFTLYLSNFNQVSLIYGSLGGIIAALVFFYICNIIFIFGAELNHQIANILGLRTVEREAVIAETDTSDTMD